MEGVPYQGIPNPGSRDAAVSADPESAYAAFSVDAKSSHTGTAGFSGPPIPEKWVQENSPR